MSWEIRFLCPGHTHPCGIDEDLHAFRSSCGMGSPSCSSAPSVESAR